MNHYCPFNIRPFLVKSPVQAPMILYFKVEEELPQLMLVNFQPVAIVLIIIVTLGFRLVYDRETGKPKGYGFCEYQDQETALSAMRNLNGREFSGRALRVDNAASEKNKEELKSTCLFYFIIF